MRNLVVLGAAALLFAAAPAWAGLGIHQTDSVNANHCKVCHDTANGSPTLRGWAGGSVPSGTGLDAEWATRDLSLLCYMCHESGGGGLTPAGHNMSNNAYAGTSHGNGYSEIPAAPDDAAQSLVTGAEASNLPYTRDTATITNMECTSCHNVHQDSSRPAPFMQRTSVAALCDECHAGRLNSAAFGFANTMTGTSRTFSTHPVAVNLDGTTAGTGNASMKDLSGGTNVNVLLAAAPDYPLGGHTVEGTVAGTMSCGTCHAVHGPTLNSPGIGGLLAVENQTVGVASGLCETCHNGGAGGGAVGSLDSSDHPIDNQTGGAFYPVTVALPLNWTTAGGAVTPASPFYVNAGGNTPVCSSCHDTHGGINNTPLLRYPDPVVANTFTYDTWCWACHLDDGISPMGHHSNTGNWAASQLICNDCHGSSSGSQWTAHNGFWSFPIAVSDTDSAFCEGCHTATNPRLLLTSGQLKGRTDLTSAIGDFPSSHGNLQDVDATADGGSHQVDSVPDATNPNLIADMTLAVWDSTGTSEAGAGNMPICESCHNILVNGDGTAMTLTSGWEFNLLLEPYEDDGNGTATAGAAVGDSLCRNCHNNQGTTGAADFVHNPEAHTVAGYTYPAGSTPYGRSTDTVMVDGTCIEATTADAATAPGLASYVAADATALNCDSCHRPHNADNDSLDASQNRYLILETSNANTQGSTICVQCHDTDIQCQ